MNISTKTLYHEQRKDGFLTVLHSSSFGEIKIGRLSRVRTFVLQIIN